MRYTAESTMDERSLRDVERWKEKIEVRLDNRQVFFLFFGSALVACLLFVLGVLVGKRLESRGRAEAPEIEDPLALLDRVAATPAGPSDGLTFPRALLGSNRPESKLEARPTKVIAHLKESKEVGGKDAKDSKAPKDATEKPTKEIALRSKEGASSSKASSGGQMLATSPAVKPTSDSKMTPDSGGADSAKKPGGHFTLQLSSFQDRTEADAFAAQFTGAGAYVVTSVIPGKGTWFRVRAGDFASSKEAESAKLAFEQQHSRIAYVAPR